ncbi:MAG: homoserine kinase [Oscillospiraceae bacterium]|nr:homoserine kinase [Oscillospiraceae bacterium]
MKVTVCVPATTANLGPGFDSFGLALTLYNHISLEETESGLEFIGCPADYANEDNLIFVSYKAAMDAIGIPVKGLKVEIASDIPISRGLGSSAALLTAGAMGANALHGNPLSLHQILEVTNPIEGHPDNLAPAIFGGLTASMMLGDQPITVPCTLHPDWKFLALVPDFPLSTSAARGVLPASYSRADAVYNVGRGALVIKALELGDEQLLAAAMDDKIHQPYRRSLIADYDVIESMVQAQGAAFCLSGAGPTLLCVTRSSELEGTLREQLPAVTKANWTVLFLQAEHNGAQIV